MLKRFIVFVIADVNAPLGGWNDVLKDGSDRVQSFDAWTAAIKAGVSADNGGIPYVRIQVVDLHNDGKVVFSCSPSEIRHYLKDAAQGARQPV